MMVVPICNQKIIKTSIERFFESSPKTFDIVYIDACASLISDQHALRCVSSLFQNHRLNSPGVLITNFSYLDNNNIPDKNQYVDLISRYNFLHNNRNAYLINDHGNIRFEDQFDIVKEQVEKNLETAYGDFITAMVCNAASITVPSLRFCNSNYLQALSTTNPIPNKRYTFQDINTIKYNTVYKYFAINSFLEQESAGFAGIERINKLASELTGKQQPYGLLPSLRKIHDIRNSSDTAPSILSNVIIKYFDSNLIVAHTNTLKQCL